MTKVTTASGLTIEFDENRMKDWRFAKALAKCEKEETALMGITFVIPFVFGEEGEEKIMKHLEEKDGSIKTEKMIKIFREIMELTKEQQKK